MNKGLKPAIDLLYASSRQGDTALAHVLQRTRALKQLDSTLRRRLPADLAAHVHVANVRDKRLIMIADSAAWATRLRFQGGAVLRELRSADGGGLARLDIHVRPRSKEPYPQRRPQPPSAAARRHIEATAAHITDEALANALRRLAQGKMR